MILYRTSLYNDYTTGNISLQGESNKYSILILTSVLSLSIIKVFYFDIILHSGGIMITIQDTIQLPDTYPLERLGNPKDILFFDIETTGFSGDTSQLYLIGCTYYTSTGWQLIQWFADTKDSELQLLHAFFDLLSHFSTVVHFNGDGFDIPYLLKRCAHYHLDYTFSKVKSIDIYKKFRPYKKLLGLSSLKQKSIEQFLGVQRKDTYSGGELILVYHDYLHSKDPMLYHMLLLHNTDDLKGMPSILPALYYPDFLESSFTCFSQYIETLSSAPTLMLQAQSQFAIPVPFSAVSSIGSIQVEQNIVTLQIPLYQGTLKYFYPNYKEYYYLPAEDRAIHKSVGEFVEKSARKKATAQTCYMKQSGLFLPQLTPLFEPILRQNPKDTLCFSQYKETLFSDPSKCTSFIHQIFACAESSYCKADA